MGSDVRYADKLIQAKDLSELNILTMLAEEPRTWHCHWTNIRETYAAGVLRAMRPIYDKDKPDAPEKVLRAKLSAMVRKGFVGGCDCGCRGDWHITDKGCLELLRLQPAEAP
jgi:hypothetical protein